MIQLNGLTKRYGEQLAVDDLSFTVRPGLVTGFLGPNGAGKSTAMRMILGLDLPTAGTATINGRAHAELVHPLRTIGAMLDARAVHPRRTAYKHLLYLAQTNGLPASRVGFAALDPSRPIAFTGPQGGPPAGAPVLGDEARLRQVVSNLVGNAVTHTPAGTPVRIGVGTDGADAVLVIEDKGPGLPAEEVERVFDRFHRADASRARATGGAGLGLAIVRSIVGAHGGHVELRSSPGEGASFRIRLPAAGAP
ncbi:ATP-binding protein [Sinosporangium siamense]|uniref:histidine kinase n=1 Tax=Sinosporangium siamense TaxID=1367973 RepID=A0A919RLU6_9ACTN|nr:ATP-binding protein [Sinosporangium siamense]GII96175.1 hypothetical protein Ssi02_64060 [Sinosporangium siamense]